MQENDSRALPPADGHSLEKAQFKTLRSACSLKPESQIENRIRYVLLLATPLFSLTHLGFSHSCLTLHKRCRMLEWASSQHYLSLERDENSLVFLIFR